MTTTITEDELKHKIPKQIKTNGDAQWCNVCNAYTVYDMRVAKTCAVCQIKSDVDRFRYRGKYVVPACPND